MEPGELTVSVAVGVDSDVTPDYDSFAWQVLTTLASRATAENDAGSFAITLTMESGHPEIGF
jgi:serine/threonine-protein kinase RsbW